MATPLKDKLRTAAAANAGLQALLGTSPFRWWNLQLNQNSAYPAIVAQIISDPQNYAFTGMLPTSFTRVQFTLWDTDSERLEALQAALYAFLAGFSGTGITGLVAQPNFVMNSRDGMYAQTQPVRFLRIIDAKVFNNSTV